MNPTRRAFLRSSSATIALPFLESLGLGGAARAAGGDVAAAAPTRMIFLGMGYGVTKDTWFPDKGDTGEGYALSEGLAPLAAHQDDFTVVQGLQNQFSNEAHWGSTFWLTGANRYAEPGQSFHNSISVDQVAAAEFGQETRFSSVQLGCAKPDGHGPGLSMAWSPQGKPMSGLDSPVAAFHRLFSEDDTPLEQRQAALQQRRSILDTVLEDANGMGRKLNAHDRDKLDEYFQSIRDIETRISKEEEWLEVPKNRPAQPLQAPGEGVSGVGEIEVMYDLMIAAMQVDASRVFTYRMPVESLIKSLGATISAHNMSHYDQGERKGVSQQRDLAHARLLSGFIDRLKAVEEPDGSRLFDNVSVVFGSNISTVHNLTNCPTILTGGAAGVEHGRHLVMEDEKTPLCNLWLSLLRGVGIEAESHGDSTGAIPELFA